MSGNMMFPAFCLVVLSVHLVAAHHSHFMHGPPRTSPRSWGMPNEIFGSTGAPMFRPTPAVPVLIAGHGPPVARHNGPVRHGRRPLSPPFPLMTSTPIPLPSSWPTHGAQIQRAQETSHYEYEVNPPFGKPPTLMRSGPHRRPPQFLVPTQMPMTTTSFRPDVVRALPRDFLITTSTLRPQRSSSPPPPFMLAQRSTSPPPPFVVTQRSTPPPPFMVTGPPRGGPPYATPSDAEFQEGFRILHDLFMEDAGADIRSNLVGGTDVSFSGGYFPPVNGPNNTNSIAPRPTEKAPPNPPQIEITPAKEQGVLMAGSPPKNEDSSSSEEERAPSTNQDQEKQGTELSYGPPHFQHGPPEHTSFMFSDPHEPGATYNLYSNNGYEPGPPPPFHSVGNSILPQPLPPSREQQMQRGPPPPPPSQDQGPPAQDAPRSQGGYNRGPPPTQGAPRSPGGYGRGPPPPPIGNSLRSGPPPTMTPPVPMPMMMMPLGEQPTGNEPPPSSDEIQKALGVLARFASKQAHNMGMAPGPHMGMLQMMQGPPPNPNYGPPQPETASTPANAYGAPPQQNTPSTTYGSPSPQQTPPSTTYGTPPPPSVEVTPPLPPSSSSGSSTSSGYTTTTETADAITISDSPEDPAQSSPFPSYGPPQTQMQGGYGGYQDNVEYSSGGGWGQDMSSAGGGLMVLKNLGSAVTGGIRQVGALKAGILNAGLNVIGGLGHAKGDIANSLKIPIMPKQQPQQGYGWAATQPTTTTTTASTTTSAQYGPPAPQYGPPQPQHSPQGYGWGPDTTTTTKAPGLISTLLSAGRQVVGGVTGTVAKTGKAAVGIGLSKNQFITNHVAIKGQAFTDLVSKKLNNKNDYFLNVLKHVASIFATTPKPSGGWSRR